MFGDLMPFPDFGLLPRVRRNKNVCETTLCGGNAMKCRQCGSENSGEARFCAQCGKPMSSGSLLDRVNPDLAKSRQQIRQHLEATKASLDAQIAQFTSSVKAPPPPAARPAAKPAVPNGARSLIHPLEMVGLLMPLPDQITQSKNMTLSSPFIQNNELYSTRIASVNFRYFDEDTTVNAFATDHPVDLPDGGTLEPPAIIFMGGLALALRVVAAALAVSMRPRAGLKDAAGGSCLAKAFRAMGSALVQSEGKFDLEMLGMIFEQIIAPEIVEGNDRFVSLARSLSASMESAVIAHEAGHISLSHTLGLALNFDVSRNQEREADSFASSVLSSSPFREYLFLGQVFVTLLFTWLDHVARTKDPTTHPLGRERFFNVLTNNSAAAEDAADQFGLTRERLIELLPPDDAQTITMRFMGSPGRR
jgi:hypothetical protein